MRNAALRAQADAVIARGMVGSAAYMEKVGGYNPAACGDNRWAAVAERAGQIICRLEDVRPAGRAEPGDRDVIGLPRDSGDAVHLGQRVQSPKLGTMESVGGFEEPGIVEGRQWLRL